MQFSLTFFIFCHKSVMITMMENCQKYIYGRSHIFSYIRPHIAEVIIRLWKKEFFFFFFWWRAQYWHCVYINVCFLSYYIFTDTGPVYFARSCLLNVEKWSIFFEFVVWSWFDMHTVFFYRKIITGQPL